MTQCRYTSTLLIIIYCLCNGRCYQRRVLWMQRKQTTQKEINCTFCLSRTISEREVMVLFSNINLNQRVEVLRAGLIFTGTVKFKGCLNREPGEWVGVALDTPDGLHDGMIHGRRYFSCRDGHAIFTTASQIRFIPLKRCLYNRYRTVERVSGAEEELFDCESSRQSFSAASERDRGEIVIDSRYKERLMKFEREGDDIFQRPYFPLNHSIGNLIPSAVMLKPDLEKSKCFGQSARTPIHNERMLSGRDFIATPTIPKSHMPHSAQKRQASRGWSDAHYTREITVNTARDSIKYNQWNDISA